MKIIDKRNDNDVEFLNLAYGKHYMYEGTLYRKLHITAKVPGAPDYLVNTMRCSDGQLYRCVKEAVVTQVECSMTIDKEGQIMAKKKIDTVTIAENVQVVIDIIVALQDMEQEDRLRTMNCVQSYYEMN